MSNRFAESRPHLIPSIIVAGLLVGALAHLPYGFYTFLRWCACALGVFVAVAAYERRNRWMPWPYAVMALLLNPIVPVHLDRGTWAVLVVIAAVLCLAGAFVPLRAKVSGEEG